MIPTADNLLWVQWEVAAGAGLSQGNCGPIRLLGQVRWLLSCLCQTSEGLRRTGDQRAPSAVGEGRATV